MIKEQVVNLIGLSAMFTGPNKMDLATEYKLQQFHGRIRDVLERNHRTSVIGMDAEEAVRMYIISGWEIVELIENGMPPVLLGWAEGANDNPRRMRLWVQNDKVVRALAG